METTTYPSLDHGIHPWLYHQGSVPGGARPEGSQVGRRPRTAAHRCFHSKPQNSYDRDFHRFCQV